MVKVKSYDVSRICVIDIINEVANRHLGTPSPSSPLYMSMAHFKKELTEELEFYLLSFEASIRKEYSPIRYHRKVNIDGTEVTDVRGDPK